MTKFIISDTHFDHRAIIRFCNRPFSSLEAMNQEMVRRWNKIVRKGDTVYHLGDVALGRQRTFPKRSIPEITNKWLSKLNGRIVLINGNHDPEGYGVKMYGIKHEGIRFLLIHNPAEAPFIPDHWTIHGHVHNNNIYQYPFISHQNKTINACVEFTAYKPVNLDYIVELIKEKRLA